MKRFLKHLFLSSLATLFLVSCGSKNENIENTDTLDDEAYQVSEEEFKNMNNFGTEYSCDYKLYSGNVFYNAVSLIRDNNKIKLSKIQLLGGSNVYYYSIVDGNTYKSIKYENDTYENIGNYNIAEFMPLATSYIKIDEIYKNVNFDSKSNDYVLKNYKKNESDTFSYEMHFKFENKKLSSYKMIIHIDDTNISSKVTIDFNYDNQDIQFPEEVINMLNN